MTDTTYQPKVYKKAGGNTQVIANGGEINVEPGGKITADGTQAAAIDAVPTAGSAAAAANATAINSIRVALAAVGIIASE